MQWELLAQRQVGLPEIEGAKKVTRFISLLSGGRNLKGRRIHPSTSRRRRITDVKGHTGNDIGYQRRLLHARKKNSAARDYEGQSGSTNDPCIQGPAAQRALRESACIPAR